MSAAAVSARERRGEGEDQVLARRAAGGSELAFEAIVGRYRVSLLRYAERIAGPALAEDAVQQGLVNAWRALRGGCEVRELRGWLYAIVHRSALEVVRADRRPHGELPPWTAAPATPDERFELTGSTHALLEAVARLPDAERQALISTSVHGRSGRHVAGMLGVTEPAVRQLVFRARARLRAAAGAALGALPLPPVLSTLRGRAGAVRRLSGSGTGLPAPGAGAGKLVAVLALSGAAAMPLLATGPGRANAPAAGAHGHGVRVAAGPEPSRALPAIPSAAGAAAGGATAPSLPGSFAPRRGGPSGQTTGPGGSGGAVPGSRELGGPAPGLAAPAEGHLGRGAGSVLGAVRPPADGAVAGIRHVVGEAGHLAGQIAIPAPATAVSAPAAPTAVPSAQLPLPAPRLPSPVPTLPLPVPGSPNALP